MIGQLYDEMKWIRKECTLGSTHIQFITAS